MTKFDDLLRGLPRGDVQYVRDHDNGLWAVCIFTPDSTEKLTTVAEGMNKGVACWLMHNLKIARNQQ